MDELILFVLRVSLMAIPLYLCNGLALVFGGKTPIDFGKKFWDGRPILGKGKTFKGTAAGLGSAFIASAALALFFPKTTAIAGANYALYGSLLCIGAVLGDFAGSFAKRRYGLERGKSVFWVDQLDFVAGGLILASLIAAPTIIEAVFLLAFTMLAHVIGNWIAFIYKMKKVPW
jgi:CDP-2,3-bis-(O-geranylgeranyl)-sn-glycerol synthase